MIEYKMTCGETVRRICERFGFNLEEVLSINAKMNPDRFYEDRIIFLPSIHD